MYAFDLPWLLVLLPLPVVTYRLLPAYLETRESVRVPLFAKLARVSGQEPAPGAALLRRGRVLGSLVGLAWMLLVVAAARPQRLGEPVVEIETARDVLVAVDLSGSMGTRDFTDAAGEATDRLAAVKEVLTDFVERRRGDRLGLVVFGSAPYLQVPFTDDHATFLTLLDEAAVRMAGPQTSVGDAIGLAIQLFEASENDNRVLILMTDGNDTGSLVPPIRAAKVAAEKDITIHPIAVGDPTTVGEDAIDLETLDEVASRTGGVAFRAEDRAALEDVYVQLERVEPDEFETMSYRPATELYHWPLGGVALLAYGWMLAMLVLERVRRRRHA